MQCGARLFEEEMIKIGRAIFRCEKKWLGTYRVVCEKLDKEGSFCHIGVDQYGDKSLRAVFYRYIGAE